MKIQWHKVFLCVFIINLGLSACKDANVLKPTTKIQQLTTAIVSEILPTKAPSATKSPPHTIWQTSTPIEVANEAKAFYFSKSTQNLGNAISFSVVVADLDLDQDNNIFFANYSSPSQLWLNKGNGEFSNSRQVFGSPNAQGAHGVGIQDLNGDEFPDIFLIYHGNSSKVFFNDGLGGFSESQQTIGNANDNPQHIVLGDIDNDGAVNAFLIFDRTANCLWLNNRQGYFERSEVEFGGRTATQMLAVDFNGDEMLDLVYCYINKPGKIWFNAGLGGFEDSGQAIGDQHGCDGLDSGDIDGDGDPDIVVGNVENGVRVWLNENGPGIFSVAGLYFDPGTTKLSCSMQTSMVIWI